MRRYLRLAVVFVLVTLAFPVYGAAPRCTIVGTSGRDFLAGTPHRDVICGRGGPDFLSGGGGDDVIRGGPDADTIVGGDGHDVLRGGGGPDRIFAVDGRGGDRLRGGPGSDQCYGEKNDRYRRCERVATSRSPTYPLALVEALSDALENSIGVAQIVIGHTPPCAGDPGCGVP